MRLTNSACLGAAFALSVALACEVHGLDPYRQNEEQRRALQDPEKNSRPVTNTLKGAEIKEFRDKMNAVKQQVFEKGNVPGSAAFRAIVKDEAGGEPTSYLAEAKFNDFSPAVRSQIESKLSPSAPRREDRIEIQIEVGEDAVAVATARVVPPSPANAPASNPARAERRSDVDVPRAAPGAVNVSPVRVAAPAPGRLPESAQPAARDSRRADRSDPGKTVSVEPARISQAPSAARASIPFPGLPAAVRALVGEAAVQRPAADPNPAPAAVLPLPSGEPLIVRHKSSEGGVQTLTVTAPPARLPEALKAQIRADKGPEALPRDAARPVEVTVQVRSDRSLRVSDVRPVESSLKAADAGPVQQTTLPNNAAAQPPAPSVVVPAAPASAGAPAVPAAPSQVAVASNEPFPVIAGAKVLAAAVGLDPASVRLDAADQRAPAGQIDVPVQQNRTIRLEAMTTPAESQPSFVRAEGRFGDFSNDTKAQIREILGRFNAAPLVTDDSQVVFEARPAAENKFAVVSIAVRDPEDPGRETVVVWKEGAEPVEPPPPAAGAERPGPMPQAPRDVPATETADAPTARPDAGLAPAVARVASEAYGLPQAGYQIKRADPKGGIKIDPVMADRPDVLIETREPAREGLYDFEALGKNVDFTDAIREQIDAKLREAVENGETWATDALKGTRNIRVTFEVDDAAADGQAVRVREVMPTTQDAARDAARAMGLEPGEFFIVNVGDQALIVLERGVSAEVRAGDTRVKIVSPDGDAKVFVNANKSRRDQSMVFMFSRDSLKANRAALVRLAGPQAEAAVRSAMDGNPRAGEFIVRVDPDAEDKILVKAMAGGAIDPALVGGPKKKEGQ